MRGNKIVYSKVNISASLIKYYGNSQCNPNFVLCQSNLTIQIQVFDKCAWISVAGNKRKERLRDNYCNNP